MPRQVQRYVTGLLVEILGPAEIEKRFDWCRGDPGKNGRGQTLPFDAVWEARKLIVEVDEVQHSKPVSHFANPTGSTGYGQRFCDGIANDWGGRVYRDLMHVTDALEKLPYVDKDRMGAMGWSYGGYMMMWMQGHTDRFKCQAAMMGLYDLRSFYGPPRNCGSPRKTWAALLGPASSSRNGRRPTTWPSSRRPRW